VKKPSLPGTVRFLGIDSVNVAINFINTRFFRGSTTVSLQRARPLGKRAAKTGKKHYHG
jgi:hypothetical protein